MAAWVLPAIMLAGTAMQMLSQKKQADTQRASLLDEAEAKYIQAEETAYRYEQQKALVSEKGKALIGQQIGMYAKSGVDVTKGAPLTTTATTMDAIVAQITTLSRESEFEQAQLNAEAEARIKSAGNVKKASTLAMAGTLLAGGASAYAASK